MRRSVSGVLVVLVLSSALLAGLAVPTAASHADADCSFPVTETDASETAVTVAEPPESVVVTDAASAQTLWAIGAEDDVTGMPVRAYTSYLAGSENRTDVLTEDGTGLAVETIVELDPALVLAANPDFHSPAAIDQLRAAGLTVYQYPLEQSIEDIHAKTALYGHLLGECEAAAETVDRTRADVAAVEERVADRDRPTVLYYFYGYTAGAGTFVEDIVTTAGGENLATTAGIEGYAQINDETIAANEVDWIVTTDGEGSIDTGREPLASTAAVRNDRVLTVDADLVSQAGPRVVEPLQRMAEAFHPEATQTPTVTATPTPTAASGPGFGMAVGAVAVLAAGVLVRRLE